MTSSLCLPVDTRTAAFPASNGAPLPTPVQTGTRHTERVHLECGVELHDVEQRWTLVGMPNAARDNVVLVAHALTGTPDVQEWWSELVGDGLAIDTRRYAVLCANVLGGCAGSTGPRVGDASPFPALTVRDQACQLWSLLDAFDVHAPTLITGGSLGGMVALELAALQPHRVREVVVLAAPAAQTALGAGWHAIMRTAVAVGGSRDGLALARMAGMLSYRSAAGFESRFAHAEAPDGTPAIAAWLAHHGQRLLERFDAASYVALIDAMDRHDVGRGRGGLEAALRSVGPRITGVGIPGDLLYPDDVVTRWTQAIGARYVELSSRHGHDAFLLETEQVAAVLRDALAHSTNAKRRARSHAVQRPELRAKHEPAQSVSRIALAGCGTVGDAFAALLANHARHGSRVAAFTRVLVRDTARTRHGLAAAVSQQLVAPAAVSHDPSTLLHDDPDVLIEVMGGVEPARTLVTAALRRGIRVITANKALIAAHGPELIALAHQHHTTLDFEGAVGASIPVVRALRTRATGDDVVKIVGVLNGTTNAILDDMFNGQSLASALASAQANGFAEADPSRDLNGRDAEDKLRIMAWLAFRIAPAHLTVERRGVDAAVARWTRLVAARGERVRLLASVEQTHANSPALRARVIPVRVAPESAWGQVRGVSNRVELHTRSSGTLTLEGPGAGGHATALALFNDLLSPARECLRPPVPHEPSRDQSLPLASCEPAPWSP